MLDQILNEIRKEGPIPFERFMELALYGEKGFFASEILRSEKNADFVTSPEVSPLFGGTLAELVGRVRSEVGEPFRLVEVGAGSGSLLNALLPIAPVEAWAVEASSAARSRLEKTIPADHVTASLGSVPGPFKGLILANELIDNLPMAVARRTDSGWIELWVGVESGRLVRVEMPPRSEVQAWLAEYAGPVEPGGMVEVQLAASSWLSVALEKLEDGAVVLFDYGDTAEGLRSRRTDGTIRTYRAHHLGPDPLLEPGETDITADVNFSALAATARKAGFFTEYCRQDDFLIDLGLGEESERMASAKRRFEEEGSWDMARDIGERLAAAQTLIHPRGLGDFRVLVARSFVQPISESGLALSL